MSANKFGISFRQATLADVKRMVVLEKEVWGESAADEEKIVSRIKIFPAGNIIAERDRKIVGYVSFQYVDDITWVKNFSWSEITDNGRIAKSHKPSGEYIYGVNLSVNHSANGIGLGTALVLQGWVDMILKNKKGSFIGSRIPNFKAYKSAHPEIDVETYINLRRHGQPLDYELRLYGQEGLLPVKVLPNYFPDDDSLDYGVLVYRKNPFYNWPLRKFLAWAIAKIAPTFIRQNIATKKKEVRNRGI